MGNTLYTLNVGNSTFDGCKADGNGGAIYSPPSQNARIVVQKSEFKNNVAGVNGGAIAANCMGLSIYGCKFTENEAAISGGAISIGEGIESATLNRRLQVLKNDDNDSSEVGTLFEKNTAGYNGGAISINTSYFEEKLMHQGRKVLANINGATFKENKAVGVKGTYDGHDYYFNSYGGAIYSKGYVDIELGNADNNNTKVTFDSNEAVNGGAICSGKVAEYDRTGKTTEVYMAGDNNVYCYNGVMKNIK